MVARVVEVLSKNELVINAGSDAGIRVGDSFIIFELRDNDVFDPITKNSLGKLELVKGKGIAKHVQPTLSIIESSQKHGVPRNETHTSSGSLNYASLGPMVQNPNDDCTDKKIFIGVKVGDLARKQQNKYHR